jgi:hypothetical protein
MEEDRGKEKEDGGAKDSFSHGYQDGASFLVTKDPLGSNNEYKKHLPKEKIARERLDGFLTEKAEQRQEVCWCADCKMSASVWVREIQFDLKGDKADVNNSIVSSADYPGPVPGFCFAHVASGPKQLAEIVYWDRTEIYLGLRPRKWWVIFTDGTKHGGLCEVLNPKNLRPETSDTHIKH